MHKIKNMTTQEQEPKTMPGTQSDLPSLPKELQEIFGKSTFSDTLELLGETAAVLPKLNPDQKRLLLGYLREIATTS